MKYEELIQFNPINSVIQLLDANRADKEKELVRTYVMSDSMAEQLTANMLSQLRLDETIDNKGVLLVGNYGTGKSHLMSLISGIARNQAYLDLVQNQKFRDDVSCIAGQFEVLRIEIGSSQMSLRNIIFKKVQEDFASRGLSFDFPDAKDVVNNKGIFESMMELFETKYPGKGYLIVVDEFLDYLGSRKENEVKLDLGFLREVGEFIKNSRLRAIFGVQEKLFDNPKFSFVTETINKVKDRFEQVLIRKEDTAYVVSERILKKTDEQKARIREHLRPFCSLYSNMAERLEDYVELYPIHPSYIRVFNEIYIIENRHILKNISEIIRQHLDQDVSKEAPGIISFDSYWPFIQENISLRTDPNIKEVVDKSSILEEILQRSFKKKLYKPLALQIIHALSVHRLTTGDITIRAGLTAENLKDDLCLCPSVLLDKDSATLQALVQTVLKEIITTVSGQFIEYNEDNGQYFLNLQKDIDYDEKIRQRAETLDDDTLNRYFYDAVYECLNWDAKEHVTGFKIYEHTLNWESHRVFRKGYLFLGTPEDRPTAQPEEDYYLYFLPPFGNRAYQDEKKKDEVFFKFHCPDACRQSLVSYVAAMLMKDTADEKNRQIYQSKADQFKKELKKQLNEGRYTCFKVVYQGQERQMMEVLRGYYKKDNPFKESMELVASLCLETYFNEKYPDYPTFTSKVTSANQGSLLKEGIACFSGKGTQLGQNVLAALGLWDGERISVRASKYAKYYAQQLKNQPGNRVLNFSDIFEETANHTWIDKKWKIESEWMSLVFLTLVYTGQAAMTLGNKQPIDAANLDQASKNPADLYIFEFLSKPKQVQYAELTHLFEVLGLPPALIQNPKTQKQGIEKMLGKAQQLVNEVVTLRSQCLTDRFTLWGERLLPDPVKAKYDRAAKEIQDMLGNFSARFNTPAKLQNFNYAMDDIDQLGHNLQKLQTLHAYQYFQNETTDLVSYIQDVADESIGEELQAQIKKGKEQFLSIRDMLEETGDGEAAAEELRQILSPVKKAYIEEYFLAHQKARLDTKGARKKGELISSPLLANLKQLQQLSIFPKERVNTIEQKLTNLRTCYELTDEEMKQRPICSHCHFKLTERESSAELELQNIEQEMQDTLKKWERSLYTTLSDPMSQEPIQYLQKDQQAVIQKFLQEKMLPPVIDRFFIETVQEVLRGFEPVEISGADLVQKLESLGPCDMETFQKQWTAIMETYLKNKNTEKLRIIIKA